MQNRIYSTDNPKAAKAAAYGYLNAIHYMAPYNLAGVGNLCPAATEGCKALCLGWHSGQAGMAKGAELNSVRRSRIEKARRFMQDRAAYLADVVRATELVERKAQRLGLKLCVRLNGSTDIAWERIRVVRGGREYANMMEAFPHVQFTDYTKLASRLARQLPANYCLTYSRADGRDADALRLLTQGHNVAIVFHKVPRQWCGIRTIDGDAHDLRHLDPRDPELGVVVALTPKGHKARRDTSGFVF